MSCLAGLGGIVEAVDEIWREHRGDEESACYGAVMVYGTLDAGPTGLLSSRSVLLSGVCPTSPWLLTLWNVVLSIICEKYFYNNSHQHLHAFRWHF